MQTSVSVYLYASVYYFGKIEVWLGKGVHFGGCEVERGRLSQWWCEEGREGEEAIRENLHSLRHTGLYMVIIAESKKRPNFSLLHGKKIEAACF